MVLAGSGGGCGGGQRCGHGGNQVWRFLQQFNAEELPRAPTPGYRREGTENMRPHKPWTRISAATPLAAEPKSPADQANETRAVLENESAANDADGLTRAARREPRTPRVTVLTALCGDRR